MKIRYNPKLTKRAKDLRNNSTFSERVLWKYLKSRQMLGYAFMRQKPIGNYIVDFYCSKLSLVIEIDGITHSDKQEYDRKRNNFLRNEGLTVLHFDSYYILQNIDGALEVIKDKICELKKEMSS